MKPKDIMLNEIDQKKKSWKLMTIFGFSLVLIAQTFCLAALFKIVIQ